MHKLITMLAFALALSLITFAEAGPAEDIGLTAAGVDYVGAYVVR